MTTKRFFRLQILIVLMLTLALVSNTFSWSNRPEVKGGGYMSINNVDGSTTYTKDKTYYTAFHLTTPAQGYYINGSSCSAVTYQGTKDASTGEITYDEENIITSVPYSDLGAKESLYFKTVITNSSDVTTNTSLFIDIQFSKNIATSFHIGVTSPVTSAKAASSDVQDHDVYSAFWVPVLSENEISGSGTEYIEWYIYNTDTDGKFGIPAIYFTNN